MKNNQTVSLTISQISITGKYAQSGGNCPLSPAKLAKNASCQIQITFTPPALGSQNGTLTITDNASNSPQTINLTGNGVAAVSVSPGTVNFPSTSVGSTSAPQTVTVTNNQHLSLNFNNFFPTGDFALGTNTCVGGIGALASCTIAVTFTPTVAGHRTGTLSISDDAPNSPQTVNLSGNGVAPVLLSIAVTPANPAMFVNGTLQLTATGTYSDHSTKDITTSVTWSTNPSGIATINTSGLATAIAEGSTTATATLGTVSGSTGISVSQVFFTTGSLNTPRYYHTATFLNNGLILFAGGIGPVPGGTGALGELASSELYNPGTGSFSNAAFLFTARSEHTATLLRNGTVLIAGGASSTGELASAEVYNPTVGGYFRATNMHAPRYEHTATLLPTGAVLLVGGYGSNSVLSSAEVYNPTNGTFTAIPATLNSARFSATATVLPTGQVLIAGGADANGPLNTAELYDPVAGTFTYTTGPLNVARSGATATLLNNGQVLIANGYNYSVTGPLTSAELYDPATQTFTLTGSLASTGWLGTATLLTNGQVLVAGSALNAAPAELYSAKGGTFAVNGPLITPRDLDTATLLTNGNVLIAGGHSSITNSVVSTAELYEPDVLTPGGLVSIAITPANATLPITGSVQLIATGTFGDNSTQKLSSVTWNFSAPTVATVSNDITNSGVAYGVGAGSTIISACAGSLCGTTPLTIVAGGKP